MPPCARSGEDRRLVDERRYRRCSRSPPRPADAGRAQAPMTPTCAVRASGRARRRDRAVIQRATPAIAEIARHAPAREFLGTAQRRSPRPVTVMRSSWTISSTVKHGRQRPGEEIPRLGTRRVPVGPLTRISDPPAAGDSDPGQFGRGIGMGEAAADRAAIADAGNARRERPPGTSSGWAAPEARIALDRAPTHHGAEPHAVGADDDAVEADASSEGSTGRRRRRQPEIQHRHQALPAGQGLASPAPAASSANASWSAGIDTENGGFMRPGVSQRRRTRSMLARAPIRPLAGARRGCDRGGRVFSSCRECSPVPSTIKAVGVGRRSPRPRAARLCARDTKPCSGIREGEFVSIVGPSGCGKSTFLALPPGFCRCQPGTITLARASA